MMLIWFAETTLVATVLTAFALLASRWFELRPVVRHALWLVVLLKLVAPPIVSWPWNFPLARASLDLASETTGPSLSSGDAQAPSLPISRADAPAWPVIRHAPPSQVRSPGLVLIGRGLLRVWGVAT